MNFPFRHRSIKWLALETKHQVVGFEKQSIKWLALKQTGTGTKQVTPPFRCMLFREAFFQPTTRLTPRFAEAQLLRSSFDLPRMTVYMPGTATPCVYRRPCLGVRLP